MMSTTVTQREFARLACCDVKEVRRGLAVGRLIADAQGMLDSAQVDAGWRRSRLGARAASMLSADTAGKASAHVRVGLSAAELLEAALAEAVVPKYAISVAKKEHYLALRRQLEYLRAVGEVVLLSEVATRLLAIPAEHAPRLAALPGAAEIQEALHSLIVEALTQLTAAARG